MHKRNTYLRCMLTICLHNLQFRAFHGLYEEEKIKGNDFELQVTIQYQPLSHVKELHQTINYELVYKLIEERMQIATPLLETIVMDIAQQILGEFHSAEEVFISIKKLNPPIKGMKGSVGVNYHSKRKDVYED